VSLSSCFVYIIELPTATLNGMMAAVLQEADAAGVQTSLHQENVTVGAYTATVDAQLDVTTANAPVVALTATDLGLTLHLHMNLQVTVNGIANLGAIQYQLVFDFPGEFQKQPTTPPVLIMAFHALTPAVLNLNVSGGNITLTPALIEPQVHALYAAHPELAHSVQTGVATGLPSPNDTWAVTVDIYDDTPGSMNYRGQITVAVPDQAHIQLNMPGHLLAQNISSTAINSDITVHTLVPVAMADGSITVQLSQVTGANVTIDYASPNLFTIGGATLIANQFAAKFAALGDLVQQTPSTAQVNDAIAAQLVQYGSALSIPIFKPTPPASPTDMDLTTFVPTTVATQVLALQLQQQAIPCDTPDVFFNGSAFAVSVDLDKCNSIIQPVVASENNTEQNIQGHDVTLSNLTATLANPGDNGVADGHIWLTGEATVHLTCWPDAHINFSGPLTLTPDVDNGNIKFQAHAGTFQADNPCCGSVDPNAISSFIESQQNYPPISGLPSNFAGVGQININPTNVDIFAAGLVIRGDLTVLTTRSLNSGFIKHDAFWFNEPPGGG
jgi:hypothetical protein